jgi:hypothetical protein
MPMAASALLQRVVDALVDAGAVRWTTPELVRYLNDGQREIVVYRPDATATTATHALVAGAKQTLPAAALKLIEVVRVVNGPAVTLADRAVLDRVDRDWYSRSQGTTVKHYSFDPRDARSFYVQAGVGVVMVYGAVPADVAAPSESALVAAVTGDVSVSDAYWNALQQYVVYRAFSKDSEFAANAGRAQAAYQQFAQALGIELQATAGVAPRE